MKYEQNSIIKTSCLANLSTLWEEDNNNMNLLSSVMFTLEIT